MKRNPYTVQEKEYCYNQQQLKKLQIVVQLTKKNLSFIEAGVDINIQGREQPHKCLSRWLKIHRAYGPNGLLQ